MELIADHEIVLADTGPFCRCAECGEAALLAAADHLRPRLRVVGDVARELRRRRTKPPHLLLKNLDTIPLPDADPVLITDAAMLDDIERILKRKRARDLKRNPGAEQVHPDADRGEIATALVAAAQGWPVLMDDGFGKNLARERGVQVFTTQDLAAELRCHNLLGESHARVLHDRVYADTEASAFQFRVSAVTTLMAGRIPAPDA